MRSGPGLKNALPSRPPGQKNRLC